MLRKGILAGLIACSMMILSGCGHNSSIVEAAIINKQDYNNAVTVEYEGYYGVIHSKYLHRAVQVGQKIKVIKREYTDTNNKISSVELSLP